MPCSGPRSTPAVKSASACAAAASAVSSKRATYVPKRRVVGVGTCEERRRERDARDRAVAQRRGGVGDRRRQLAVHRASRFVVGRQVRRQEARRLGRVQRVGRRAQRGVHLDHRVDLVVGRGDPRRREQRPHRCTVICCHPVPIVVFWSHAVDPPATARCCLSVSPPVHPEPSMLSMRCRCAMAHLWHSTTARTGGERTAPDRLKWWLTSENVDAQGRLALPVAGS